MIEMDNYYLRILQLMNNYHLFLEKDPNVVSFGIGVKTINNIKTNVPSLTIAVKKKYKPMDLSPRYFIPKYINGVLTDVIQVGEEVNLNKYNKYNKYSNSAYNQGGSTLMQGLPKKLARERPIRSGLAISNGETDKVGVISCFAMGRTLTQRIYLVAPATILSRNDVMTHNGDEVYQPPKGFGDLKTDKIAAVEKMAKLVIEIPKKSPIVNTVDAALAFIGYKSDIQKEGNNPIKLTIGRLLSLKGLVTVNIGDEIFTITDVTGGISRKGIVKSNNHMCYSRVLDTDFSDDTDYTQGPNKPKGPSNPENQYRKVLFSDQVFAEIENLPEEKGALGMKIDKAFGTITTVYCDKEAKDGPKYYSYFSKVQNIEKILNVLILTNDMW